MTICKNLPKFITNEMIKETIKSHKDKFEHGFQICSLIENIKDINRNNTLMTEKCVGTECRVQIKSCPQYMKRLGAFHTHPEENSLPSFGDIVSLESSERKFICIGSDYEIRCIPRHNPVPMPADINISNNQQADNKSKEFEKIQDAFKKRDNDCKIKIKGKWEI